MEGTPIKIIYKKQKSMRCPCGNIGYGVLGSKKTGKPIQITKFNHTTNERTVIFEDKEAMGISQNNNLIK